MGGPWRQVICKRVVHGSAGLGVGTQPFGLGPVDKVLRIRWWACARWDLHARCYTAEGYGKLKWKCEIVSSKDPSSDSVFNSVFHWMCILLINKVGRCGLTTKQWVKFGYLGNGNSGGWWPLSDCKVAKEVTPGTAANLSAVLLIPLGLRWTIQILPTGQQVTTYLLDTNLHTCNNIIIVPYVNTE